MDRYKSRDSLRWTDKSRDSQLETIGDAYLAATNVAGDQASHAHARQHRRAHALSRTGLLACLMASRVRVLTAGDPRPMRARIFAPTAPPLAWCFPTPPMALCHGAVAPPSS